MGRGARVRHKDSKSTEKDKPKSRGRLFLDDDGRSSLFHRSRINKQYGKRARTPLPLAIFLRFEATLPRSLESCRKILNPSCAIAAGVPHVMDLALSYGAGLAAAGSPCVVSLTPLLLYKLKDSRAGAMGLFMLGFLAVFAGTGWALAWTWTTAPLKRPLLYVLSSTFSISGALSATGHIEAVQLPFAQSPLTAGAAFAVLSSLNPCAIPFLGIILALDQSTHIFASLIVFGLGILTPALLFLFLGRAALGIFRRGAPVLYRVDKLATIVVILASIYMIRCDDCSKKCACENGRIIERMNAGPGRCSHAPTRPPLAWPWSAMPSWQRAPCASRADDGSPPRHWHSSSSRSASASGPPRTRLKVTCKCYGPRGRRRRRRKGPTERRLPRVRG